MEKGENACSSSHWLQGTLVQKATEPDSASSPLGAGPSSPQAARLATRCLFPRPGYQSHGRICCSGRTLFKIHVPYVKLKRARERKKNLKILPHQIRKVITANWCQHLLQQPRCSAYLATSLIDALISNASKQRNPKNCPIPGFVNVNRAVWWSSSIYLRYNFTKVPLKKCSLSLLVSPLFYFCYWLSGARILKLKAICFITTFK